VTFGKYGQPTGWWRHSSRRDRDYVRRDRTRAFAGDPMYVDDTHRTAGRGSCAGEAARPGGVEYLVVKDTPPGRNPRNGI